MADKPISVWHTQKAPPPPKKKTTTTKQQPQKQQQQQNKTKNKNKKQKGREGEKPLGATENKLFHPSLFSFALQCNLKWMQDNLGRTVSHTHVRLCCNANEGSVSVSDNYITGGAQE